MIAAHKNVRILISLLKQYGIRHLVLSPGGRNMSIVKSVEDDSFFTCYSVVDERSAAYFAVGLTLEVKGPVALCCTSAQATRNYLPGMTEAFYRKAPIVAITADYDQNMTDQMNMQSFRQMSLPSDAAVTSVDLPIVKDKNDEHLVTRRVNEALDTAIRPGGGPAHINIRINQHWIKGDDKLEVARMISRHRPNSGDWPRIGKRKTLLVIGHRHPFSDAEISAIERFASAHNVAIYVNHISNFNGSKSVHGNLRLAGSGFGGLEPELLITIGGLLGDYPIDGALRRTSIEHWRVSEDGQFGDTYNSLTRIFECSDEAFFNKLVDGFEGVGDVSYYELWRSEVLKTRIPEGLPLSQALVAKTLSPLIPGGSILHFAILNSMRFWEFFPINPTIRCYSNVAGFGIDGCLSTFLGQSVATDDLCFLVVGDLSFFYDMNSLGIRHLKENIKIILVNNKGGGEFRIKTNAANSFGDLSNRHIAAGGHFGESAEGWVRNNGFDYYSVTTTEDLEPTVHKFLEPAKRPAFMEVFTTMTNDASALQTIVDANGFAPQSEKMSNTLKNAIPPDLKKGIKRILGG